MNSRFHIAVRIEYPATRAVLEHIASVLGMSSYDAKLRLRSSFPKSAAFCADYGEALELARRLCDSSFTSILYEGSNLPAVLPFDAFRMGRTPDGFIFENKREERRTLSATDTAFVVFGRKTTSSMQSEIQMTNRTYGMHGASPMISIQHVRRRHSEHSLFIVLFPKTPTEPPIRIVSDVFDFRCLGHDIGPSDNVNGLKLMQVFEAGLPDVVIDRRLMGENVTEASIPHNRRRSPDVEFAAATLLYWDQLAHRYDRRFFNAAMAFDEHP